MPASHQPEPGHIRHFFVPQTAPAIPDVARAEGIHIWDTAGRRYIDASSGPVVSNLGHGDPVVLAAMIEQARRCCFAWPTAFRNQANRALADALADAAGPGFERAFIVSGGSEGVEAALKFARQVALARGEGRRWKVVSRMPSYHGGTLGALAVTGDEGAEAMFGPMMRVMPKVPAPFTYRVPDGHDAASYAAHAAERLEQEILAQGSETVLAFILEPIGGLATGALVAPDPYYAAVRRICDRHGVLLIFDEVMSGAGRSGRFLAAHHWPEARPDLVVLAKGIGAGYTPLGILLAPAALVDLVVASGGFQHGHTYNANPLTCAVGLAVLQRARDLDLTGNAARMGARLRHGLEALMARSPIVGDVRGRGLLLAVELVADKETRATIPPEHGALPRIARLAMARGLALYTRMTNGGRFGQWLMLTPPLIVTAEQVDEICALLEPVLAAYADELAREGVLS